jgi:RNA polymerase sigma-70 factor (ECF subfamily)
VWTRDAIEALYRQHAYALFRRCRQLLRDDEGARDAMQQVFLTALEDPSRFQGRSAAGTYLFAMATHQCLNRLRNDAVRGAAWRDSLTHHLGGDGDGVPVDGVELRQLASAILEETDDETAAIALYHFVDGLSQGEVAALIGKSRVTVNHRLQELRDRVRARGEGR